MECGWAEQMELASQAGWRGASVCTRLALFAQRPRRAAPSRVEEVFVCVGQAGSLDGPLGLSGLRLDDQGPAYAAPNCCPPLSEDTW